MLPKATVALAQPERTAVRPLSGLPVPRSRRKRHISAWDMNAVLDYHTYIRAAVYPPAANMQYMVWDERLAKSAKAWATQCIWDHGPSHRMKFLGQNLSVYSDQFSSIVDLVKFWSDEKQYYLFPVPSECTPALSLALQWPYLLPLHPDGVGLLQPGGCAIHTCGSLNVWGKTLYRAVYLVCNYAMKSVYTGSYLTLPQFPAVLTT
ncbi:Peptidase inhibitor R3HDML [Fukomys damarensis]|uniref:Peptidase inhibitor R3HDML n=1 Tax=Fukomys damarensis TaxID=885580 RepID=A0A091DJ11_FUKDA|nr:Peptidase inhibitor R3HDML [Fukomys damarensis]